VSQTNWQQVFRYDRYGNRTVVTEQNRVGQEAFTTESVIGLNPDVNAANNRIVPKADSNEQYLFDASGNMTRDAAGNVYAYDAENHQTKFFLASNTNEPNATYFYDGDGRRVKKIVKVQSGQQTVDETTLFVYDGGGALVAEYTQNAPANTNPQTIYMTADTLGSPRINTNQKGEVVARHDYLPFGDEIIGLGQRTAEQGYGVNDNVRKKFTGYEKDQETGLDFAQARYYGNGLGRFTSVDPLLESAKPPLPQSWNRYIYCVNNPVNCIDPTGLDGNGVWGFYISNGRMQFDYFNSLEELQEANKIHDTNFCQQYDCGSRYEVWKGGEFLIWGKYQAARLGSNGEMTLFSVATVGRDYWNEMVLAFNSDKGLSEGHTQVLRNVLEDDKRQEKVDRIIYGNPNVNEMGGGSGILRAIRAARTVRGATNINIEARASQIANRYGATETEGGFLFSTRRSARQAASELAGDLGSSPLAIRASDWRNVTWPWNNSNRVIGRQKFDFSTGWRDDFLGHPRLNMGPHVNVWRDNVTFHFFYPGAK
jgi:RHS repeat-associated protein